jgi:dTDP-4-dehydrorhamnose reductase
MRLLLTGASGQLGAYLLRELRNQEVIAWSGSRTGELFGLPLRPVDLANREAVTTAFAEARPDLIVHTAGITTVSDCHRDPKRARQVNVEGSALLAELAARRQARLLFVSTDLVFDGEKGGYREGDAVGPLSVYGKTKVAAEQAVVSYPAAVVVRVGLLYGPALIERPAFFDQQAAALRAGRPLTLFADEWRTPLSLLATAQALLAVAASDFTGLLHLGGPLRLSRLEMGQRLATVLGCSPPNIVATSRNSGSAAEPRPGDTSLDSSLWRRLYPKQNWPDFEEGLRQMQLAKEAGR